MRLRVELLALALFACAPAASAPPPAPPPPPIESAPIDIPKTAAVPPSVETTAEPAPPPEPVKPEPAPPPSSPSTAIDPELASKILATGGPALKSALASPEALKFQVLYGVIERGKLERTGFRTDAEYFFPASSMKVPIALATYERMPKTRGLTKDARITIHPIGAGDPWTTTIAHETWKSLIVSDNFSANRMLAVVGHRELHETLWSLGLKSTRVHSGFATGAELDPAKLSPRIEIEGAPEIPPRKSTLDLPPTDAKDLAIGDAAIVDGRRVPGPLSFAEKNAMKLRELQDTLVRIMRPELLPPGSPKDAATKEGLEYLRQTLGTLPSQSGIAGYDRNVVADYTLIPFLRGIERVRPRAKFQIFSKVGQAFGFLVANAYVVEKDTGRAFFLTATIYANPDGTMNDDKYAWDTIAFPVLADVGEVFARHAFGS